MTPEIWHTLSIIGTILAGGYYIHRDIKADIDKQDEKISAQAARTDRLYEMFIELLKDKKQ
jgi:hypothetical protein